MKYFLVSLIFLGFAVQAAEVDKLYYAEVPVESRSQGDRNQAIINGFKLMLVKVTGNRNMANQKMFSSVFKNTSRYVQQYRYKVREKTIMIEDDAGASVETLVDKSYLQVFFDKPAVDRMLRSKGLAVWGKSRPQVLAWVGLDDQVKRRFLMSDDNDRILSELARLANNRGIPFVLPLMDLEDQSAVSESDLWGGFDNTIRQASERYDADSILTIRLKLLSKGFWQSEWTLIDKDVKQNWSVENNNINLVLSDGVQKMADLIAQSYAPSAGGSAQVVNIQVSRVNGFESFLKVQEFIQSQESVKDFQVREMKNDNVVFMLNLRGGFESFNQAISLSSFLALDDTIRSTARSVPTVEVVETVKVVNSTEKNPQVIEDPVVSATSLPLNDVQFYYYIR